MTEANFNVLLSANMVQYLDNLGKFNKLMDNNKKKISDLLEKITEFVENVKEVEKAYKGNLEWLAFA